jgi:hypothetical protein
MNVFVGTKYSPKFQMREGSGSSIPGPPNSLWFEVGTRKCKDGEIAATATNYKKFRIHGDVLLKQNRKKKGGWVGGVREPTMLMTQC